MGIDVAIKSAHKVSILDRRSGQPIRRTLSIARTFEGVERLKEILAKADRVEVAIEPAGNAWRPLAGALMAYGFDVLPRGSEEVFAASQGPQRPREE